MPSEKRPWPLVLDATESDDSDVVIVSTSTGRSATASVVARNPHALSAVPTAVSATLPLDPTVGSRTVVTETLPANSDGQGDADAAGGPQPLQGEGSDALSGSTSDSDESSSHWDAVVAARHGAHGVLPVAAAMPTMPVRRFVAGAPSDPSPSPPTRTDAGANSAITINLHVQAAVTLSMAPTSVPSTAVVHSTSTSSTSNFCLHGDCATGSGTDRSL